MYARARSHCAPDTRRRTSLFVALWLVFPSVMVDCTPSGISERLALLPRGSIPGRQTPLSLQTPSACKTIFDGPCTQATGMCWWYAKPFGSALCGFVMCDQRVIRRGFIRLPSFGLYRVFIKIQVSTLSKGCPANLPTYVLSFMQNTPSVLKYNHACQNKHNFIHFRF